MLWELCAHILHFLMLKQYLPGAYAFIKKKKKRNNKPTKNPKRAGGAMGDNFFHRANTAQVGSVLTAVGKTVEYILNFDNVLHP